MESAASTGLINETPKYGMFYKEFISNNDKRNKRILDIIKKHEGEQILILVKLIEHGENLNELIKDSVFLYGETPNKIREEMLNNFKSENHNILISMSSIMSEGVDIPNLKVIINASANKGDIKSLQAIGRVMRKISGKSSAFYYDFSDSYKFFSAASWARKKAFLNEGYKFEILD